MYNLETGTPYRHWKGGVYIIESTGTFEATLSDVVIYVDKAGKRWVRGQAEFTEMTEITVEQALEYGHVNASDVAEVNLESVFVQRFVEITDEELLEAWAS